MATHRLRPGKILIYFILILLALIMLLPFVWMISASLKLDKDVFTFPIEWIPKNPRWQNYLDIWTEIPLGTFIFNTAKITLIVTFLQLLTSSFAAYAFAKLNFKGKNVLFIVYIGTIAIPWQSYMVPQFIMMRISLSSACRRFLPSVSFLCGSFISAFRMSCAKPPELTE